MLKRAHAFCSPLRYPGGKGALANFMKTVLLQNHLSDGQYVEVYAGGAGIAWPLLFEEHVHHVHINDLSKPVYSFWRSVMEWPDNLCRLIRRTRISMAEWYRQKEILDNPSAHSPLELGFSTFFLNRTNRSGILTGGVIGGKHQEGRWKLDARFNKQDLVGRIQDIARYANRISLHNLDAIEFIASVLPSLSRKTLVYLDPPYYGRGQDLYQNSYAANDHAAIAGLVTCNVRQPWIVSYDSVPEVEYLYRGHRNLKYRLSYSAQSRYAGAEIMFFSRGLTIPQTGCQLEVSGPRRGPLKTC